MSATDSDRLRRRLERERAARLEAEAIAERSTRELWDRQQELVLLEAAAAAANAADSVDCALQGTLDLICRHLRWPVGQAWIVCRTSGELRRSSAAHVADADRYGDFVAASTSRGFRPGEGLPGRAVADAKTVTIPDVWTAPNFPRARAAEAAGLHGAIAVPVILHGRPVAVVECFTEAVAEPDAATQRVLGQIADQLARVFERENNAEQLRHDARHDALTGLPNRVKFAEHAARAIQASQSAGSTGVALIDLDRFKEVNDTLGHQQGDRLLIEVGARLSASVRTGDTIARLGGDEFGLVLENIADEAAALALIDRVRSALTPPVHLDGVLIQVDASVGLAMYPMHGADVETLLRQADVAMYDAKRHHLGRQVYRSQLDPHSAERLGMVAALRVAIETGGLQLHYQPQVVTADGAMAVTGVEALLRWPQPDGSYIPPVDFIPLAERTGLIRPLTSFVLQQAIAQAKRWELDGLAITVAVNVGARNLLDPAFPDEVERLLNAADLSPRLIELEITESSMLENPDITQAVLTRLSGLGVSIAIDDFGTGYSSLAQLKQLPVSVLKIDRGFVSTMVDDSRDAFIVASTIRLGKDLGLTIVAEGVEDTATLDQLVSLGCDTVQGYLFQRPSPPEALTAWLVANVQPQRPTLSPDDCCEDSRRRFGPRAVHSTTPHRHTDSQSLVRQSAH